MEIGLVFAIIAAVIFGASDVLVRRGVFRTGESYTAVLMSLFIGVLLFSLMITVTAQWDTVRSISWRALGLLAGAGILHFVAGRSLYYASVRLIGANKASAITKTDILTSVILGIVILSESLTMPLVLGVLCIVPGVVLASMEKQGIGTEETSETYGIQAKGVLNGLATGLCWGVSGILIKPAVREIGVPFIGAFVSYAVAFLVMASLLARKGRREQLFQLNRSSSILIAVAGVFSSTGQLLRFAALSSSPVSLVQPLAGTFVLYILLFSFLLNRNIEVFSLKVIIGMVLVVAGTFLLSF